jgi:hypothetical protein
MNAHKEASWKATIRELVIIVAGVLIALASNAWWEARGERTREREYIDQLTVDMSTTLLNLDSAYQKEERGQTAINSMLLALLSPQTLDIDSMRAWGTDQGSYSDPRLVLGTVTALLQTGELRLIRDRKVRVAISAYASGVAADLAELSRFVDLGIAAQEPMLNEVVRRGMFVPGDSAAGARAFIKLRKEPVTSIYLLRLGLATKNRIIYIERMRAATKNLLDIVKRNSTAPHNAPLSSHQ